MALWMLVAAALVPAKRPGYSYPDDPAAPYRRFVAHGRLHDRRAVQALLAGIVLGAWRARWGGSWARRIPPIMGIEADAGQLLGVALVVFGVYLLVAGVRSLAYLVWDNWDCLGSLPVLLGRRSFHSYFWSMLIDLAAGLWLILGSHGLVELRRRLGSDRLSSGAEGGLQ